MTLETVAAVPGVVGPMFRHLRSLRRMKRDYGWINPLQEEAENERMHLLIFMQMTQPTKLERSFVMIAHMFQLQKCLVYGETDYFLKPLICFGPNFQKPGIKPKSKPKIRHPQNEEKLKL